MTRTIDTLGKALRHHFLLQVRCPACHASRYFPTADLANLYGAGRDPLQLHFECERCRPNQKLSLVPPSCLPAETVIQHLERHGRELRWVGKRLGPVRSLRDAWTDYETLVIVCETYGCGHSQGIDYAKVAHRLGWDRDTLSDDFLNNFFCSRCRDQGRPGKKLKMFIHRDERAESDRAGPPALWDKFPQSELPPPPSR